MHLARADALYFARLTTRAEDGGFWTLHAQGLEPPADDSNVLAEPHAEGFAVRAAWRVKCPFCDGSQFGDPNVARFCCCDCGNAQVDGQWVRVEWPDNTDEIEQALLARSNPTVMHWYPDEHAAHLHAENVDHGVMQLEDVPRGRQRLTRFLVDARREIEPVHAIAKGTFVHPESEWYPKHHARIVKALGKNVSESDIRAALMRGR